jgi:diguanylate cyclase (GGDEF)-like protein/PAS domain S-box-containing protein
MPVDAIFSVGSYAASAWSGPPLVTALAMLVLGGSVAYRERGTRVSLLVGALAASVAVWLSSFAVMYSATDAGVALFWARVGHIGVALIPCTVYHFSVVLLNRADEVRRNVAALWLASIAFALLASFTSLIVPRVESHAWGFYPRYGWEGVALVAYVVVVGAATIVDAARELRRVNARLERRRVRSVSLAMAAGYLALVDFLPSLGIPIYPLGYIAVLVFLAGMASTVIREGLVEITPRVAAGAILETMRGSVLVTDLEGRVQVASDATYVLLDCREDELLGRNITDLSPGIRGNGSTLEPFHDREMVWRTRGEETVDVSVSGSELKDRRGRVVGMVYSAEDIRSRKREDALRESESRYRTLVESMAEGVIVVDNDDVVQFVNTCFAKLFGYEPAELIGTEASAVLLRPDDRALMAEKLRNRQTGMSEQYTIPMVKKNGDLIWTSISSSPLYDSRGHVTGSIGICLDLSERWQNELSVRESEARYRLMAEHATDMICRLTPEGKLLYVSPASRFILGYEADKLVGTHSSALMHTDFVRVAEAFNRSLLKGESVQTITVMMVHRDGRKVWVESNCRAVRGEDGRVTEVIAVSRDVTERLAAEEQIQFQAYHDVLTGLPNRRLFEDRLNLALAHARRQKRRGLPACVAVLFLDLDHFKLVNDTFGHSKGDELLKVMAERLRHSVRDEDSVARFGGDEFIILLPHAQKAESAALVAQKLLAAINAGVMLEDEEYYPSASIGIAIHPENGDSADALLRTADAAMYRAKEISRNSYQFASTLMDLRARERLMVDTALRRAVENAEFALYYQPIVDPTGAITSVEALLRWRHPQRGLLTPESFMSVAEESGTINLIGEWVLRTACADIREWQREGIAPARTAINMSAVQLEQQGLAAHIAALLAEFGLSSEVLELEITETAVLRDRRRAKSILETLSATGLTIAIDDFGTGYSSLTYLRTFPIRRVKIDRSFIKDIETQPNDAAIVGAVITMAHALGIEVVAEGVETEQQVRMLTALECEHLQGFYFSEARPADEITRLLRQGRAILGAAASA